MTDRKRKWIADEIERLDPEVDYSRIWALTTTYYVDDFAMNLIYTIGIQAFTQPPAGSIVLTRAGSGKALATPDRRAEETLQHFWRWFEEGPDDATVKRSVEHVNAKHASFAKRYPGTFPERDFIYTACWIGCNVHRIMRWAGRAGFSEKQKIAAQRYWSKLMAMFHGDDGYVRNFPPTFDAMLAFLDEYENEPWEQVATGKQLAEALIDQFNRRWLPRRMHWFGRQLILSVQKPSIRRIMQLEDPNPVWEAIIRRIVGGALALKMDLLRDPVLSTPAIARLKQQRPGQHVDPPLAR